MLHLDDGCRRCRNCRRLRRALLGAIRRVGLGTGTDDAGAGRREIDEQAEIESAGVPGFPVQRRDGQGIRTGSGIHVASFGKIAGRTNDQRALLMRLAKNTQVVLGYVSDAPGAQNNVGAGPGGVLDAFVAVHQVRAVGRIG